MITLLFLLKKENQALRSVLSEWEEDKNCYVQMILADDLRRVIETIGG